jgi:hypothetical protein
LRHGVAATITFSVEFEDGRVMNETINGRDSHRRIPEHRRLPLFSSD